jgi:hypothetical protein
MEMMYAEGELRGWVVLWKSRGEAEEVLVDLQERQLELWLVWSLAKEDFGVQ